MGKSEKNMFFVEIIMREANVGDNDEEVLNCKSLVHRTTYYLIRNLVFKLITKMLVIW